MMKTLTTNIVTTNSATRVTTTRVDIRDNIVDSDDMVNAYLAKNTVTVCKPHNPGSKNNTIKCSKPRNKVFK